MSRTKLEREDSASGRSEQDFPLADVEAALLRAAMSARDLARRTSTPLVIVLDGRLLKLRVGDTPELDVVIESSVLVIDPMFRDVAA